MVRAPRRRRGLGGWASKRTPAIGPINASIAATLVSSSRAAIARTEAIAGWERSSSEFRVVGGGVFLVRLGLDAIVVVVLVVIPAAALAVGLASRLGRRRGRDGVSRLARRLGERVEGKGRLGVLLPIHRLFSRRRSGLGSL